MKPTTLPSSTGNPRRDVIMRLVDATRAVRTFADHLAQAQGTTLTQWRLMKRLADADGLTQADLAEDLEIQPISLVRLLDRMEAQGILERRAHPTDRRAKLVFITEAGRQQANAITPMAHTMAGEVTDGLSMDDIARLLPLLEKLNSNARRALARRQDGKAPAEEGQINNVDAQE